MKIDQRKPNFTEYGFLNLLVSILKSEYHKSIIEKFELEKNLYDFYDNENFHFLFEDVIKRESVDGNNYVDLNDAFQKAYIFGLLTMIQDVSKDSKFVITLTEEEANDNLSYFNEGQIGAMRQLLCEIHNNVSRRRTELVSIFSSKEQEELFAKCAKESRNTEARLICDGQEKDKTLIRKK